MAAQGGGARPMDEVRAALQRLIDAAYGAQVVVFSIPAQPSDADLVVAGAVDELEQVQSHLQERNAALDQIRAVLSRVTKAAYQVIAEARTHGQVRHVSASALEDALRPPPAPKRVISEAEEEIRDMQDAALEAALAKATRERDDAQRSAAAWKDEAVIAIERSGIEGATSVIAVVDALRAEREQATRACAAQGADVAEIGRLCAMRDDEYPLKAVQRTTAELGQVKRGKSEAKKLLAAWQAMGDAAAPALIEWSQMKSRVKELEGALVRIRDSDPFAPVRTWAAEVVPRPSPTASEEPQPAHGLQPCPFCGGSAEMEPWHGGGPEKQRVSCANETCAAGPAVTGETPQEAAEAWNARVEPQPAPQKHPFRDDTSGEDVCADCGEGQDDHHCACGGEGCTGPTDVHHQCGGPSEACLVPGCKECGQPTEQGSWCVECGPVVRVDEDGCCAACGTSAMGPWADRAVALWRASQPQPAPQVDVERVERLRLRGLLESIQQDLDRPDDQRKWHGLEWSIRQSVRRALAPDVDEDLTGEQRAAYVALSTEPAGGA